MKVSALETRLLLFIVGILAAIATPGFRHARERANQRACYANQKTIAGALEMYDLDNNTATTALDDDVWRHLKEQGYLQTLPQDPGQGADSLHNYQRMPDGNVGCTVHGLIQPPQALDGAGRRTSAREEFEAAGFTDETVLARANPDPYYDGGHGPRGFWANPLFRSLVGAFLPVALFMAWRLGRWLPWRRTALVTAFAACTGLSGVPGLRELCAAVLYSVLILVVLEALALLVRVLQADLPLHAMVGQGSAFAAVAAKVAKNRSSLELDCRIHRWAGYVIGPWALACLIRALPRLLTAPPYLIPDGLPTAVTAAVYVASSVAIGVFIVCRIVQELEDDSYGSFLVVRCIDGFVIGGLMWLLSTAIFVVEPVRGLNDVFAVAGLSLLTVPSYVTTSVLLRRLLETTAPVPVGKGGAVTDDGRLPALLPTCPVCATTVAVDQQVRCGRCGTVHHRECFETVGHCARLDCPSSTLERG